MEPTAANELPDLPTDPESEWLVDAYNVIQVTLLGGGERSEWWRAPMRERLIERARGLPAERGRAWLVFDGRGPSPEPADPSRGPQVVFAPSADEWIVRRVKQPGTSERIVVTSDRPLRDRCRHHGARVILPGEFVRLCRIPEVAPSDPPSADATP